MFSGIVEEMATVVAIRHDKENIDFTLKCSFVDELGIDQSVAHNASASPWWKSRTVPIPLPP